MLCTSALLPEGLQEENSPPTAEVETWKEEDLLLELQEGGAHPAAPALRRSRTRTREVLRGLELLRKVLTLRGLTPRSSRETDSS